LRSLPSKEEVCSLGVATWPRARVTRTVGGILVHQLPPSPLSARTTPPLASARLLPGSTAAASNRTLGTQCLFYLNLDAPAARNTWHRRAVGRWGLSGDEAHYECGRHGWPTGRAKGRGNNDSGFWTADCCEVYKWIVLAVSIGSDFWLRWQVHEP
jgi:hypothetical protein